MVRLQLYRCTSESRSSPKGDLRRRWQGYPGANASSHQSLTETFIVSALDLELGQNLAGRGSNKERTIAREEGHQILDWHRHGFPDVKSDKQ